MFVAIRKGRNGGVYLDRNFFDKFSVTDLERYGYTKTYVPDECRDFWESDFDEDLTFSIEKYNERKARNKYSQYESEIVFKIRQRYSLDQELAILRQRDTKADEFYEYNNYVELCKAEAKAKFNL